MPDATRPIDAQNLLAAIRHRRTIKPKGLKPDPVDAHLVEQVLDAARWAPCHGMTQPWRFTVFTGEGRRELERAMDEAAPGTGARVWNAPVWIIIAMEPGRKPDGSRAMPEVEEICAVACAVQNMHLAASALGLGAMWSTGQAFMVPTVQRLAGVEGDARMLGMFIMGWPAVEWPAAVRKEVAEFTRWVR